MRYKTVLIICSWLVFVSSSFAFTPAIASVNDHPSPKTEAGKKLSPVYYLTPIAKVNKDAFNTATFREGETSPIIHQKAGTGVSKTVITGQRIFAIMIILIIATGILLNLSIWLLGYLRPSVKTSTQAVTSFFSDSTVRWLKGLYFDKSHTWAFMDKGGNLKIGVDDFLQNVTGQITRVVMAKPGEKIKKGGKLLSLVQHGKQLNLYSPVSGTIIRSNPLLTKAPDNINSSPYTDGWVYEVEPVNWSNESRFLFNADKYRDWLKEEFSRLKDFLSLNFENSQVEPSVLRLQDGGELRTWILAELGPEVWEEFQNQFLDANI